MAGHWTIAGEVTHGVSRRPAPGMRVAVVDVDRVCRKRLGEAVTDSEGRYEIRFKEDAFSDERDTPPDVAVEVRGPDDRLVVDTRRAVVRRAGRRQTIHVQLPGARRPSLRVAGLNIDRRAFERLEPDPFLELARALVTGPVDDDAVAGLAALCPDFDVRLVRARMGLTPLVHLLDELPRAKRWPEEVRDRFHARVLGADAGTDASHDCGPFRIDYATTGAAAPPPSDAGGNILVPGTTDVVGTLTAGNGVPDYVERLCFWLRRALDDYTQPPFALRDPSELGTIPVVVKAMDSAFVSNDTIYVGNTLSDAVLAFHAVHELLHIVQRRRYESAGSVGEWNRALREGGAILAEDAVFDHVNRYVVHATNLGSIKTPWEQVNAGMGYDACLLLKYACEQQSKRVEAGDEPMIGVDVYRRLLEHCDGHGYGTDALAAAIEDLPWFQTFFAFKYLDDAKLDRTSSETLLGNFWLALYLKDRAGADPDRRFGFMENGENAQWDDLVPGIVPNVGTLGQVTLTKDETLSPGGTLTLSTGSHPLRPFAGSFYRVAVDEDIDTFLVAFEAEEAFTRPLVQIVLLEANNVVRDILRSDRREWTRTIANLRDGVALDHILVVVSGTDTAGTFSLKVTEAEPAPDVMVTRWHHAAGTHYEIDSRNWAWTWVSPDIWVDNDGDGQADDVVRLGENNSLTIRLRNQGRAAAAGMSVDFWYQDAAGGLSDAAWQPVRDAGGQVQSLTGLALAAGATDTFAVNWAPQPSGDSTHFCVRAVVTVPGDPNVDNKRCLSNFGNVRPREMEFDVVLLRRDPRVPPEPPVYRTDVVPRTLRRWIVHPADLERARTRIGGRAGTIPERFRIQRQLRERHAPRRGERATTRVERVPDPYGHYPTDPRSLPPGLARVPMITFVQRRGTEVVGGFTLAIREA